MGAEGQIYLAQILMFTLMKLMILYFIALISPQYIWNLCWLNGLTQRPCPWCRPWRGFPKSNVQCRMSNEVQWPIKNIRFSFLPSPPDIDVVGVTLYNVQTTVPRTITTEISDCHKPTTLNNIIAASEYFPALNKSTIYVLHDIILCWCCWERRAITSRKIWSCLQVRKLPG